MDRVFITTEERLKEWLEDFTATVFSLDLETTGLGYDCGITGVSICDGGTACFIDFLKVGIQCIGYFIEWLCENCEGLILHNASFDLRVLCQYGMEL